MFYSKVQENQGHPLVLPENQGHPLVLMKTKDTHSFYYGYSKYLEQPLCCKVVYYSLYTARRAVMPKPRKAIINTSVTSFYHCISRCVRSAYLCGEDLVSGESYEHRRQWVQDRLLELTSIFAIEVCSFAVMSNHLHVVLSVDTEACAAWSMHDVLLRWRKLFKGHSLVQAYLAEEALDEYQLDAILSLSETYRARLQDISWFMRTLNEPIARQANKEDKCTGRFWEGRFKCQPLLDEAAVLSCMAYVDLNPVRANLATTLEASDHTSIQLRIRAAMQGKQPEALMKFNAEEQISKLNVNLKDYLALVDATGRVIREDKAGAIQPDKAKLLSQIHLSEQQWIHLAQSFESTFKGAVGKVVSLESFCKHQCYKKRVGLRASQTYLEAS